MATKIDYWRRLQAILDLGFEHNFDVDQNIHKFMKKDEDGDVIKAAIYPPVDEGGWILGSSYSSGEGDEYEYGTYNFNETELTVFLNFMKTLPKPVVSKGDNNE